MSLSCIYGSINVAKTVGITAAYQSESSSKGHTKCIYVVVYIL